MTRPTVKGLQREIAVKSVELAGFERGVLAVCRRLGVEPPDGFITMDPEWEAMVRKVESNRGEPHKVFIRAYNDAIQEAIKRLSVMRLSLHASPWLTSMLMSTSAGLVGYLLHRGVGRDV